MNVSAFLAVQPRHAAPVTTAFVVLCLSGCHTDALAPVIAQPSASAQYGAMAFTAIVNARTRSISIAPPMPAGVASATLAMSDAQRPALSLLGSDAVRLVPSSIRVSALGAYMPNKVRVSFEVTIQNKLAGITLVAPSWPTPPVPAVILFPLDYAVALLQGGATGGDGNEISVSLPNSGAIVPSGDWNGTGAAGSGAPFNFFTQTACDATPGTTCFRWIAFGARPLASDGSATRTVGFDIDPTVGQFQARLIVAADLAPAIITVP